MIKIKKPKLKYQALSGGEAVAEAMRQIDPEVVAIYPITPQTPIAETFAKFVSDGKVSTELIRVESEHSAMSATVGAAAAGVRAMTATSSQGLALMGEILFVASGLRLPIVMPVANRALSAPINIHCDHSDSMALRDSGWIQIYCENAQEAYDNTLIALKVAENKKVRLPIIVAQDGFITSHSVENVLILPDKIVKKFIGKYTPDYPLLNIAHPVTYGALELPNYYFETKRQQIDAMEQAKKTLKKTDRDFFKLTGRRYNYFEEYKTKNAEFIIVVLGSTAGTTKEVVDKLRKKGLKVGVLKVRLFRPFPEKEITRVLSKTKKVAVLDRSVSFGSFGPLFTEIRSALFNLQKTPAFQRGIKSSCNGVSGKAGSKKLFIQNYIYGLGGRDITPEDIEKVFQDLIKGDIKEKIKYIGLRD